MKTHSVREVAKLLKVHWMTLYRWIREENVRPSIAVPLNGRTIYRLTDADVERARRHKARHYWEGRGGRGRLGKRGSRK